MIRVIFDISVSAVGHYNIKGKTGVFRVVENLMYHLKDRCALSLCAGRNMKVLAQARDYWKNQEDLKNIPLIGTGHKNIDYLAQRLWGLHIKRDPWYLSYGVKFFSSTALKALNLFLSPLDMRELSKADIFHSPFFALPDKRHSSSSVRRFITIHDLIPVLYPHFFEPRECRYMKKILNSIMPDDFVLCISQSTKNDLCQYRAIEPSQVFVTYPGVSEHFMPCSYEHHQQVRKKYTIPEGHYFLSLATLEPRKNIAHTIKCFSTVIKEYGIKDLSLVLVGTPGWKYGSIYDALSHDPLVKKHVILTGFADDKDLPALYSGARAFIYPSLYEGFGLPPLEAMKCGCPVITSTTSSLPEVVGDAALMVDPKDSDALCHFMAELYKKDSVCQEMSQKSVKQAELFKWGKCAEQTIEGYKKALL